MLKVLEQILIWYDNLIAERLSCRNSFSSKDRKGLGSHVSKGEASKLCRCRKAEKFGYRKAPRTVKTVFGKLKLNIRQMRCCSCGKKFSPLLRALNIGSYCRRESNVEHAVVEAVIDTNYRRLIEGRSIDISLGGVHNIVVGSDIDRVFKESVNTSELSAVVADGTGVKQTRGSKGELRTVIGITHSGCVKPLGCFTNTDWREIEKTVKKRLRHESGKQPMLPFVFDGEPGLDGFLSDIVQSQRCIWHASRGLYHALWEDGLKKKQNAPEIEKIKSLVGIELPEQDFELIKESDKEAVKQCYESSKKEIKD